MDASIDPAARCASTPLPRERRPEWRISSGELRCRVEAEGIDRVAARLATTPDALRAAIRGDHLLEPERVLALRLEAYIPTRLDVDGGDGADA